MSKTTIEVDHEDINLLLAAINNEIEEIKAWVGYASGEDDIIRYDALEQQLQDARKRL